jgi:hypothetical protein
MVCFTQCPECSTAQTNGQNNTLAELVRDFTPDVFRDAYKVAYAAV